MTFVVVLVSLMLAAVASFAVLAPFRRGGGPALEPLRDPLDDERLGLLRSLRDLDDERASGALAEADYRTLRHRTELRAVAVIRALQARDGAVELSAEIKRLRPRPPAGTAAAGAAGVPADPPAAARKDRSRLIPALLVVALIAALATPLLINAISTRQPGQEITGGADQVGTSAVERLKDEVRAHPSDVGLRLRLAQQYVVAGLGSQAAAEYSQALRLDPRSVEARAGLGYLLFRAGQPAAGLKAVNQALAISPRNAEALYDQGIILLDGLHQPAQAEGAFRAYVAAAPRGAHAAEVRQLLVDIHRFLGSASPSP